MRKQRYNHIFFDLDRTIWDFEKNSTETLCQIHEDFESLRTGAPNLVEFIDVYKRINEEMWNCYRKGTITKEALRSDRYNKTLKHFGIFDEDLAERIGLYYITECPKKTALFDDTHEVLVCLKKKYRLHIITNGFEEVQHLKMKHSNLTKYFEQVITSEQAGYKKPSKEIFEYAFEKAQATAVDSVMIGDDWEVDIIGAEGVRMDSIHFDPNNENQDLGKPRRVTKLVELLDIL